MPPYLTEVLKTLGFATPFVNAAATYALFHWLDKRASGSAKAAISSWVHIKEYDRAAVSEAILELFDRVYSPKLLSLTAFTRVAVITTLITVLLVLGLNDLPTVTSVLAKAGSFVISTAAFNILIDYVSLFFVRSWLRKAKDSVAMSLVFGPALGMIIVIVSMVCRELIFLRLFVIADNDDPFWSLALINLSSNFISLFWGSFSIAAMAVHLWLPLFGVGVGVLKGINYLRVAVGWAQWFIKQGRHHPLDAVGYVAAVLVFVVTIVVQYWLAGQRP
jgi:hypothetical protein